MAYRRVFSLKGSELCEFIRKDSF